MLLAFDSEHEYYLRANSINYNNNWQIFIEEWAASFQLHRNQVMVLITDLKDTDPNTVTLTEVHQAITEALDITEVLDITAALDIMEDQVMVRDIIIETGLQ